MAAWFEVGCAHSQCFTDTKACSGDQSEQHCVAFFRIAENCRDLCLCDGRTILLFFDDQRQLDEFVVPSAGIDLIAFFVDCRSDNHLHHHYYVDDCLWSKPCCGQDKLWDGDRNRISSADPQRIR